MKAARNKKVETRLQPTPAIGVFFDTIGCRLNQSEIEFMARQARSAGHELVNSPEEAGLIVLNSCTVTSGADSETRRRIKQAHRLNPQAEIAITGCWATLYPEEASRLPGVTHVVANQDKSKLIEDLIGPVADAFEREPVERKPIPGIRMRTRAFIKAQDGCDHQCAYCLTTIARGQARSLSTSSVVDQVKAAVAGGAREAVLSGVQLSSYGRDLADGTDLSTLIRAILAETDIARLRLSSLEPWGLPNDFFDHWENPRMCRQLHLPLQAGSQATLRRMRRPMTPGRYRALVERARQAIPGLAITTDILTGFPGESAEEYQETLEFVRAMKFSDAHVFPFSSRPGTVAASLPNPLPSRLAKERARQLRQVVAKSADDYRQRFLGTVATVLWESAEALGPAGWRMGGLTDNYIRVKAVADRDRWNELCRVRLQSSAGEFIRGTLLST